MRFYLLDAKWTTLPTAGVTAIRPNRRAMCAFTSTCAKVKLKADKEAGILALVANAAEGNPKEACSYRFGSALEWVLDRSGEEAHSGMQAIGEKYVGVGKMPELQLRPSATKDCEAGEKSDCCKGKASCKH